MTNNSERDKPVDINMLMRSGQALLDLDANNSLVPHGIGGHARSIIQGFIDYRNQSIAHTQTAEPVAELILDPMFLPALKSPLVDWKININNLPVGNKLFTHPPKQELSESFQLHEIFGSIEECPPILESDSFIVRNVKNMAHLINLLSSNTDGWVRVDDRLPESGDWYLVAIGTGMVTIAFLDSIVDGHIYWLSATDTERNEGKNEWEDVTHWKPLPQPPSNLIEPAEKKG